MPSSHRSWRPYRLISGSDLKPTTWRGNEHRSTRSTTTDHRSLLVAGRGFSIRLATLELARPTDLEKGRIAPTDPRESISERPITGIGDEERESGHARLPSSCWGACR